MEHHQLHGPGDSIVVELLHVTCRVLVARGLQGIALLLHEVGHVREHEDGVVPAAGRVLHGHLRARVEGPFHVERRAHAVDVVGGRTGHHHLHERAVLRRAVARRRDHDEGLEVQVEDEVAQHAAEPRGRDALQPEPPDGEGKVGDAEPDEVEHEVVLRHLRELRLLLALDDALGHLVELGRDRVVEHVVVRKAQDLALVRRPPEAAAHGHGVEGDAAAALPLVVELLVVGLLLHRVHHAEHGALVIVGGKVRVVPDVAGRR